jgi:hypothetical protein
MKQIDAIIKLSNAREFVKFSNNVGDISLFSVMNNVRHDLRD